MYKKYIVRLTEQEREQLDALIRKGKSAADKIKHANILLKADADGVAWNDEEIAAAFAVHTRTVAGMRERCVQPGLEAALNRKKQERPSQQPLCDGEAEAHLIALSCSKPPPGHARWTLRGCLKSSGCREPTPHQTRHREVHHGLTALGQPFRVFAQTARLVEPRQGAFDHPPPRQQHKALRPFRTPRDPQDDAQMVAHPGYPLPPIAPIHPEQPQFFPGAAELGTKEASASGVGDRGRGDDDGHQKPQCIDAHVPLTALDVVACIIAALASEGSGLDALAIPTASCGVCMVACLLTHLGAQGLVEALPVAPGAPLAEIPVHTGPLWIFMGQHPPCDAHVDDIKERMDSRPHLQLAVAPTRLGWWE